VVDDHPSRGVVRRRGGLDEARQRVVVRHRLLLHQLEQHLLMVRVLFLFKKYMYF